MSEAKMRYCCYCGEELGLLTRAEWRPSDTCGARECDRYARDQDQAEREEAHYQLDRDQAWQAFQRLRRAYAMVRYPTLNEEIKLLYDTADAIAEGRKE